MQYFYLDIIQYEQKEGVKRVKVKCKDYRLWSGNLLSCNHLTRKLFVTRLGLNT